MEELNEGRHQVKRKYGDHGRIRINENGASVRDTIIKYVAKNYVTEEDLHNHLIRLEEDRGGAKVNKATWFKRNQKFFTTFEKKGNSYYSLSKYGQRVYEMILKRDSLPKEINESKYRNIPSLSESISIDDFEANINESKSEENKIEKWLKKNGKRIMVSYSSDYDWTFVDDGGMEFDVKIENGVVTLYDGEQETTMDPKSFIKDWM